MTPMSMEECVARLEELRVYLKNRPLWALPPGSDGWGAVIEQTVSLIKEASGHWRQGMQGRWRVSVTYDGQPAMMRMREERDGGRARLEGHEPNGGAALQGGDRRCDGGG